VQAILNPLQALLNALVYRKWGDDRSFVRFPWTKFSQDQDGDGSYILDSENVFNPKETNGNGDENKDKEGSFNGYGSL